MNPPLEQVPRCTRKRGPKPVCISGHPSELLTPAEVGHLLKLSPEAVTKRFADVQGVHDLGEPEIVGRHGKSGKQRPKRRYRMLRIPRWVLERYLQENTIQ